MQLIVFEPDGSVEYTRNALLDTVFEGERKSVTRMSIIEHDENRQLFYVDWLTGPFKHYAFGDGPLGWEAFDLAQEFKEAYSEVFDARVVDLPDTNQWFMRSYEAAVEVEVAFATFLREQGYSLQ